jgi:hypothetical protein
MEYGTGCLVCGEAVIYSELTVTLTCYYCGVRKDTNASCRMGHYVCDACHKGSANDLIERYCSTTDSALPLSIALTLMKNPVVKMHGPEHHFLVPAVLLAAYCHADRSMKRDVTEKIREARKRAEEVKGGFCGFQGACGAAVGAGIFMSLITGATPLSDRERQLSNRITAECLRAIAEKGGPRCCKRESFTAIITSVAFVRRELGVSLPVDPIPLCVFTAMNRECIRGRCSFYGAAQGAEQQEATPGSFQLTARGEIP